MSVTAPRMRPGPTEAAYLSPLLSSEEEVDDQNLERQSYDAQNVERSTVTWSPGVINKQTSEDSIYSLDDWEADKERMLLRRKSLKKWADRDINSLYKEYEAETRFLKTKDDMSKIQSELKKIKDAGEDFVYLTQKVEGLETTLKTAAKDKFSQEKEMLKLRNEISELKEHNISMEILIENSSELTSRRPSLSSNGTSLSFLSVNRHADQGVFNIHNSDAALSCGARSFSASPNGSPRSNSATFTKMKEQEALIASLHRKIDFLELQNKDKEVESLKVQVAQLSETIEKLIGGMQKVSKSNPKIVAQLDNLKEKLPNAHYNSLRNTFSLAAPPLKPRIRSASAPFGKDNQRHLWVSKLRDSDFKEGPVSFVL